MARKRLPRDPNGQKIYDDRDPYLMARQTVRDNFNDLLSVALGQAKAGDSALLVRLLNHLEAQPTRIPGISADSNPADLAADISRWAAVGGMSIESARRMIAMLRESQSFVKRSKIVDAMIHSYEQANQPIPDRVRSMQEEA